MTAARHRSITRLEARWCSLEDEDIMAIVNEVKERKTTTPRLTQLNIMENRRITRDGRDRLRHTILEEKLDLLVCLNVEEGEEDRFPFVEQLPPWPAREK